MINTGMHPPAVPCSTYIKIYTYIKKGEKAMLRKLLAAILKKENMKFIGTALIAVVAVIAFVTISTGGNDKVAVSQQTAKMDNTQQTTKSIKTAGKQSQKIKPLTSLRKSKFRTTSGPPTKRLAGR